MKRRTFLGTAAAPFFLGANQAFAQSFASQTEHPNIGFAGDSGPKRSSECGVGALMAWADKLWAVTYLSEPKDGSGTGLYEIDENLKIRRIHESNGVYANRLHHLPSNQINIGPYMIDLSGNMRIIESLVGERLTAAMPHLTDPEHFIYILSMEGMLHELNVRTLQTRKLFDLTQELKIKGDPHFKGGFTSQGRMVVANNTYTGPEDLDGRLAEWDGKTWTILKTKPFMEVASRQGFGDVLFATGWDERSAILKVRSEGKWFTYRLPKANHTFDQYWCTEWTRIREVETERYLMDCHGMFYELPPFVYGNSIWGIRPICTHLRIIPDFCSFRGFLVLGGNEAATAGGNFLSPQSQSGLWFGKTDDLWNFGKPKGWGGVWRASEIAENQPSDPFLMTGFDKKVLHLVLHEPQTAAITIEVDFLGQGSWHEYLSLPLTAGEYKYHVFPEGFSAHWVRLRASSDCKATAEFIYT